MTCRRRLAALLCMLAVVASGNAQNIESFDVAIPEQPLASALQSLANQLEVQIVFFSGATKGLTASPLTGSFTRDQALDAILAGTGLRYVFLNENSVAIQLAPETQSESPNGAPAVARDEPREPERRTSASDVEPARSFGMEEIVVTGTASRARTKYESSVGISTFDRGGIARQSPTSTADLISSVPGFWVESTAGRTQGNVFARGIVQDGGYRYVGLIEDGMPVYPVFELSFYNPDQFIRVSESVARVEVVRGGTAPIFTPGAVGGTINFINDTPPTSAEFRLKTGISDFDSRALDMHLGTPLSRNWGLSAAAYVHTSDGIRDPGYVADRGGQVRLNLVRSLGNSELSLYTKYLDDKSLFVVPIPLRGSPSNPSAVDGTAAGLYSLHSSDIRDAGLPPSANEVDLSTDDLADGIHPRLLTTGIEYTRHWRSDVWLTSHTRYTNGDVSFNAIFTGDVPVTGTEFAEARNVAPDFTFIRNGNDFDADFLVQNHGHWAVFKKYRALQNDSRLTIATAAHELTVGIYAADYSMADRWSLGNLLLTDVGNRPQRLFLPGVTNAAGFTQYSFLNLRAHYDAAAASFYVSDEWEINDRFRLDLGFRYDTEEMDASISNGIEGVDLDGDPSTMYDIAALAGSDRTFIGADFDHASYSLGFNYDFTDRQASFGHITRSAKLPHFDDIRNDILVKDRVTNVELGYKASLDSLAMFLTAYRTEFDNVPFSDILVDGSIVVRRAETWTHGIELEGVYEPIDTVAVQFSMTWQDPEYRKFSGTSVDNSGNRVRRIPRTMIRIVPSIWFAAGRGRAFLAYSHYGQRYANDENTVELPSFTKLDAGVEYAFNDSWTAQLNVDNLSNEVGLTEGNPRTDVGASGIGQLYNARALFGRSLTLAVRYSFQAG